MSAGCSEQTKTQTRLFISLHLSHLPMMHRLTLPGIPCPQNMMIVQRLLTFGADLRCLLLVCTLHNLFNRCLGRPKPHSLKMKQTRRAKEPLANEVILRTDEWLVWKRIWHRRWVFSLTLIMVCFRLNCMADCLFPALDCTSLWLSPSEDKWSFESLG